MSMARLRTVIESLSEVEYAEPNYIYRAIGTQSELNFLEPNDPRFGDFGGLNNTGANEPGGSRGVEGATFQLIKHGK